MSIDQKKMLELIGGEEGYDDALAEAVHGKIDDEGQLLFNPPDKGFREFSDEEVDANASALYPGMKRQAFEEERVKVRSMLETIFQDLRNPEIPSEVRLNPHCQITITEDDIDGVLEAYLDDLED